MSFKKSIIKNIFATAAISFFIFHSLFVHAANVGFVPSTGLWFSENNFSNGKTIQLYTAVINSDFFALNGIVTFYDNNQVLDSATVNQVSQGSAQVIHINWTPSFGQHTLNARFTKAIAVDAAGKQTALTLSNINSIAGAPLAVNNSIVNPVVSENQVQQNFGNLIADVVGQPTSTRTEVPIGAIIVDVQSSGGNLAITNPNYVAPSSADPFAKNKAILDKAKGLSESISSTAGKIGNAYAAGEAATAQGHTLYAQAQSVWSQAQPYVEKVKPYWNTVSNNNEPKRIAIILGVIIVLYGILRFSFRRRRGVFN